MIDAGLPLVQCLEILGEQEENRKFREAIQQVRSDVEQGSSLADAMRKQPSAFNNLYTNMIAAGEAGGILDIILQRLATYIEKVVKLNAQVKAALMYPVPDRGRLGVVASSSGGDPDFARCSGPGPSCRSDPGRRRVELRRPFRIWIIGWPHLAVGLYKTETGRRVSTA
jgi:hypothetical protein